MQIVPKKYLVETEDDNVDQGSGSQPFMESDVETLNMLNDIANTQGLTKRQEKAAKTLLSNNKELAKMVVEYGNK